MVEKKGDLDSSMNEYLSGQITFQEFLNRIDAVVSQDLSRLMPVWIRAHRLELKRRSVAARLRRQMP